MTSALRPDIVILALYPGNDAVEAGVSARRLDDAGGKRPADDGLTVPAPQWRCRLMRRSVVVQVVRLRR